MAFKLGLQDVSYDPELHTGQVDFDFFDSFDSPVKLAQANNNYPTKEEGATRGNICEGTINIAKELVKTESLGYKTENASATAEEDSEPEFSRDQEPCSGPNSDEPSSHRDSGTDSEPASHRDSGADGEPESHRDSGTDSESESHRDPGADGEPESHRDSGTDSESESHRDPGADGEPESHRDSGTDSESESHRDPGADGEPECSADHQSDSAPCSPSTERLHAVVRDVTAIQESLHRLRLSADASRVSQRSADPAPPRSSDRALAPPRSSDPALAPSRSSAGSGRVRRLRPRSGCPLRKRWSCNLTEAALTRRQIAQLLPPESDSSSSDMVGDSDPDSDSGAAVSADVETWLGAAGSSVGSAARLAPSARSRRSQAGRSVPAPVVPSGRSAPSGRLGLLAEAVRHLDRANSRTAPPAPRRPVRAPHRKNMSFTNEEVRQIDRHNRILLNKIVAQQSRPPARPVPVPGGGRSRGTQDQIRRENMILLQKIHTARPSRSVISGFHETPPPVRPILERGAVRHRTPWIDR